jgi:hypothetical protein
MSELFVMCINNRGHKRSLKLHVVYKAEAVGNLLAVVDECGTQRLCRASRFVPVQIPDGAKMLWEAA